MLADLALPQHTLLLALLSFNLGVKVGQLALVGLFLGMCWALRRLDVVWPRWAAPVPAWAVGGIAALWFVERAFGVTFPG